MLREVVHHKDTPATSMLPNSFKRVNKLTTNSYNQLNHISENDVSSMPMDGLMVDCIIEHERFGVGKVIRLEGKGENLKATVQFENAGVKQLLVKFARFKVCK